MIGQGPTPRSLRGRKGPLARLESLSPSTKQLAPGPPIGVDQIRMKYPANVVTIHPYFKVHPGQLASFKAGFGAFIDRVSKETGNLFYEFTVNGDVVFCREGYVGAEGVRAHLSNIGDLLGEALKIATLERLEVHGPAAELDQLRDAFKDFETAWFAVEAGVRR